MKHRIAVFGLRFGWFPCRCIFRPPRFGFKRWGSAVDVHVGSIVVYVQWPRR